MRAARVLVGSNDAADERGCSTAAGIVWLSGRVTATLCVLAKHKCWRKLVARQQAQPKAACTAQDRDGCRVRICSTLLSTDGMLEAWRRGAEQLGIAVAVNAVVPTAQQWEWAWA